MPSWRKRPKPSPRRKSETSGRWPATSASGRGAGTSATASPATRTAAHQCFSFAGENQFHAIFGGGPSYIVHPVRHGAGACRARCRVPHRRARRRASRAGRGVLRPAPPRSGPRERPGRRRGARRGAAAGAASRYAQRVSQGDGSRGVDARRRQRGGRARDGSGCLPDARGSSWAAWRRSRGVCRRSRKLLAGQRITPELAARAGEIAVADARPLSKNAYKVPMTKAIVERTILQVGRV